MGFMHATPGDMKSFRSSAERMALMVGWRGAGVRKRRCDRRKDVDESATVLEWACGTSRP